MNANFACPKCKKILTFCCNAYTCITCDIVFPFEDNLLYIDSNKMYLGEMDKEELNIINENIKKFRNIDSCYKKLSDTNLNILRYLAHRNRCMGINKLNLNKDDIVLDIGSGFGFMAMRVASTVKEIHAVDWIKEKALFSCILSKTLKINNFFGVCASLDNLPYNKNIFDAIILNGFLEWIPLSCDKNPIVTQQHCLNKCYSLLKDTGKIYIGIENRFWYRYFIGANDPHERKLKFVTVLPRKCSNFISSCVRNKDYKTHIHSLRIYNKLLRSSGFTIKMVYIPIPNYSMPENIYPYDEFRKHIIFKIKKKLPKTLTRIFSAIISANFIMNLFVHSYILIAEKKSPRPLQ